MNDINTPNNWQTYFEDCKNGDDVDRTVWFISTLSPHNLWKGREAIQSLIQSESRKAVEEFANYVNVKLDEGLDRPIRERPIRIGKWADEFLNQPKPQSNKLNTEI